MMRSLPTHKAATAAVLLALPLGLAACSSSSKPDAVGSSSTPSASSSHGTTPGGKASTGGTSSDGSGGKPTKAQVARGMSNYFVGKGMPRSLVNDVTTCVADKGYSQFSDKTLRALKDGKVDKLNPLDAGKLTNVTTTCLAAGRSTSRPVG